MKGDPWRTRILWLFLLVFSALVLGQEWQARNRAQEDIKAHARVISDALWNFNRQGGGGISDAGRAHPPL